VRSPSATIEQSRLRCQARPSGPTGSALAVGQCPAEQALPRDASRMPQQRPAGAHAAPRARTRISGRAPTKEFHHYTFMLNPSKRIQAQQAQQSMRLGRPAPRTARASCAGRQPQSDMAADAGSTSRGSTTPATFPWSGTKRPRSPNTAADPANAARWRRGNPAATLTGRGAAWLCGARLRQARPPETRWRRWRLLPVLPHLRACLQPLLRHARCRATLGPRCRWARPAAGASGTSTASTP